MNENITTKVDLHSDGLLWMINTTIFHPRGLALTRNAGSQELYLQGDGSEAWQFLPEVADEKKAAFESALKEHLSKFEGPIS